MEIHFVGSGDAFGNGGRFQTCIRLQAGDYTVLVDCGATSLSRSAPWPARPSPRFRLARLMAGSTPR